MHLPVNVMHYSADNIVKAEIGMILFGMSQDKPRLIFNY